MSDRFDITPEVPDVPDVPEPQLSMRLIAMFIGGFGQDDNRTNGLVELRDKAAEMFPDRRTTSIAHRSWKDNAEDIAHMIVRQYEQARQKGQAEPKLALIPFSWGNPTALKVLGHLKEAGITADLWAAIDPVPRLSQVWFSPRNLWKAWFSKRGSFPRPANVDTVQQWRQVNDRPVGREVKITKTDPLPIVYGTVSNLKKLKDVQKRLLPFVQHDQMDNRPEIHREVLEQLVRLAGAE